MEQQVTTNTSKHVALLIATMGSFLTPFMASSVNIALPSIGIRLSLIALELSWVATAYILAAAVYTGLSVGPLVGGFLTGHLGWRRIFLLNALLGFVTAVTVFWKLKGEWAGAKGEKFD